MCMSASDQATLNNGWSEQSFYDKRKTYMLKAIDESFNEHLLDSKIGSTEDQYKSKADASKLRDDQPKLGQAVTLDRTSETHKVTDDDISLIEQQAMVDQIASRNGLGFDNKYKEKYPTGSNPALSNSLSLLGRTSGVVPHWNTEMQDVQSEDGSTSRQAVQVADYRLSQDERDKLKSMDRRALLDKFYGSNTPKF